jgi:hypothetical protein
MAQNYVSLYERLIKAKGRAMGDAPAGEEAADGEEFLPKSLVTLPHAATPPQRESVPAAAVADPRLGILQ